MAGRVSTATALLLLAVARVSGGAQQPFFYSGAPGPAVPQFYVYDTQMVASPVVADPARTGPPLQCQAEGFFPHPTNCARFYRCVDYAGTGQFFSRYEFQCPAGQMFLAVGKNTCVPGDCEGVVPLPVAPAAPVGQDIYGPSGPGIPPSGPVGDDSAAYPQTGTAPQPVDSAAPAPGGAYPQTGTAPQPVDPAAPVTGGAYPQTGTAPQPVDPAAPATSGAYPQTGTTPQPDGSVAPAAGGAYPQPGGSSSTGSEAGGEGSNPQPGTETGGCPARYVQDTMYCNIYLPCPDDNKRYLCTAGTVFDQARQMCRLDDQEDVCAGKPMFVPSPAFRADLPHLNQGGPLPLSEQTFLPFNQGQTFSSLSQGQSFPSFSQGQTFPSFSQGQAFPSFSQGQTFPSFSQGQTFPSFSQGQTQQLVYTAQVPSYTAPVPSYTAVSGVPQFPSSDVVSGQGTSFYAQPSYVVPDYFVIAK